MEKSDNVDENFPKSSKHYVQKQTKEVIWNVYKYLKGNKEKFKLTNLLNAVAEATGFSRSTVGRVIQVGNKNENEASCSFSGPKKREKLTPK